MGGSSKRSFRLFRKLCGDHSLKNVVIVTTMWGKVTEAEGARRETQLREDDRFFKSAIQEGATMARHHNTFSTALDAVRIISENHQLPIVLTIQEELVDEKKKVVETDAGKELNSNLQDFIQKHSQDMKDLAEEIQQSINDRDMKARKELGEELTRLRQELARVKNELSNLHVKGDGDIDAEQTWKLMSREARVITMFMRSQGTQESPEKSRFWSALGDTTKAATELSIIFDKYPMDIGLQDDLFNYRKYSYDIPPKVNRDLKQWIKDQHKAVRSMEAIMDNAIRKARKQRRQRRWIFW
jgi:hypothetical protein